MSDLFIFILLAIMVIAAYHSKLLTMSGAIAAYLVGFLVVLGANLSGLVILGLFFISSNVWSKIKSSDRKEAEERVVKGSQRDWQQVAANGGIAAIASALYYVTNEHHWLIGFCVCIAAANSDTWASEIGSMSKKRPIYIKNLKRVERGISGAISLLGTFAAAAGSFFIALVAFFLFDLSLSDFYFIFILGFLGNLIDTFLGAFIQAGYRCSYCGVTTEKTIHCGRDTSLIKGYSFFNNDVVNFSSVLFIFLVAILIKL